MLCQSSSFAKVLLLQSRALAKVLLLQRTSCQSSFFAKVLKTLAGFLLKYKNHIIIKIFIKLIKNGISPRSCGHNSYIGYTIPHGPRSREISVGLRPP